MSKYLVCLAPEVVVGKRYDFSADWWGMGCLIFEMVEGRSPFRTRKETIKRDEVDRRVREDTEQYSNKFSIECRSLCQLVNHEIFQRLFQVFVLLNPYCSLQLLQKDVQRRLGCRNNQGEKGADDLKAHSYFKDINWRRLDAGLHDVPFVPDVRIEQFVDCFHLRI